MPRAGKRAHAKQNLAVRLAKCPAKWPPGIKPRPNLTRPLAGAAAAAVQPARRQRRTSAAGQYVLAVPVGNSRSDIFGGAVRPKLARTTSDRRSGWHGGSARPSARTGAYAPRYNIFDTISADGADAARQTQPHDQGNPAGSIRSASLHIHSAMVIVVRSVDLVCPSLEAGGGRHGHRRNPDRE
jgi:hypothetical protein